MRRLLSAVGGLLLLACPADGREKERPPSLESLTRQAAELHREIHREHDPEDRKERLEELELVHHQMGPTDANGKRIRCRAMWHDQALDRLREQMKRLTDPKASPAEARGETLVRLARFTVRRMARTCLAHGWRIYTGPEKYQVDVFGQYLANNLPTLDKLMKPLSGLSAPAPGGAESGGKETLPLAKARAGLVKMIEAAETLTETPSDRPKALIPPLGTFLEGLAAVREAVLAAEPGEADEAPPAEAEPKPPKPPPMTEAEKERVAALQKAAKALDEADWADLADHIEHFASMIEAGFKVSAARPKARELLGRIERAADLARSLAASTLLEEDRLGKRHQELLQALNDMAQPAKRRKGYARLAQLEEADAYRRGVEEADLGRQAGQGLLRARNKLAPQWKHSDSSGAVEDGRALASACASIGRTLERMQGGPPDDMAAKLQECYRRQKGSFLGAAKSAGERVLRDPRKALPAMQVAARRGEDLALIVRAKILIQAIKRYRPPKGGAMYQRVLRWTRGLAAGSANTEEARDQLGDLIRPFEALERFPKPESAHQLTLTRLLGKVYVAAVAKLSRDLRAGINYAAAGNPSPLWYALRPDDLFRLARTRALAEKTHLQQAGVANLAAFSMPPGLWTKFHKGIDRHLQAMFAAYAGGRKTNLWRTEPPTLETVYRLVVAAQRLTLQARSPAETDLDFLMRNLQRVAMPNPPDRASDAWRVGYHVTEAAVTTAADIDTVAAWHRRQMRYYRKYLDQVDLSAPLKGGPDGT